jgi:hypothetical protein
MQILFNGIESTFGYFETTRRYIDQHGKPLAYARLRLQTELVKCRRAHLKRIFGL